LIGDRSACAARTCNLAISAMRLLSSDSLGFK
jgi:hypothetical protein